jgi:hypothetical protein
MLHHSTYSVKKHTWIFNVLVKIKLFRCILLDSFLKTQLTQGVMVNLR